MTLALFRQEALDHRRHQLLGDVLVYQPITQRALAWTFIAIAVLIVSFLFWGEYARKETVHGILVPDRGVSLIYARSAGTVVKVNVAENQIVAEGEPLFTVLVEQSTQGGGFADSATLEVIARRKLEIAAQIKLAQENAEFDRQNLTAQIASISEEIEHLERQRKIQVQLTELSEQDLKAGEQLRRTGTLPETEYRKRAEAYLSNDQREADLARQIASRRNDLA
jgi:membrane fusion protein